MSRNRLANGSEIEAAEAGRGHGHSISRTPTLRSRRNALRSSALRSLFRLGVDRGTHLGQRPGAAQTGRTHDRYRTAAEIFASTLAPKGPSTHALRLLGSNFVAECLAETENRPSRPGIRGMSNCIRLMQE
jgi:hypothetical protein